MKTINNYFLALLLFFISGNFFDCYSQSKINAKIVTRVTDNLIDIKAVAQNNDQFFIDDYSYLLFSLKKGEKGNYSRNTQSGKFSLQSGEEKELSTLKISIQKNEECKVYLFLRKDGLLISKDSSIIYSSNKEKKVLKETEFELKGIVVDDVITKIGKDFHDLFYQYYSNSSNKYPFIITIKEKPYFGRSSIISIVIDDKKIVEFYSKPDEEFLKSAVKSSLERINLYAVQRKILFKNGRI